MYSLPFNNLFEFNNQIIAHGLHDMYIVMDNAAIRKTEEAVTWSSGCFILPTHTRLSKVSQKSASQRSRTKYV